MRGCEEVRYEEIRCEVRCEKVRCEEVRNMLVSPRHLFC